MKILYIVAATLFCFSCNTNTNSETSTSPTVGNTHNSVINHTDTVYLVRNADVTPANAYSDLFLDSSVINEYISENKLSTDAEKGYKSFYNYRNDQFAWFSSQGLTEQAKAFWNLQDKLGSKADKGLRNRMDTLLNNDSLIISRYDTAILKTELALTNAYLNFYKTNRNNLQFASLSPEKAIPVRKQNTILWADSILQQRSDSNFSNTPTHYSLLKEKLKVYTELAKNQGWPTILGSARQLKKGSSSPAISTIKKRLQLTGEMAGTDTSAVFNDTLVAVIKNYQMHNGMQPTGIITDTLIRSLNVPVEKRLQQMIMNIQRAQWMPASTEANYISVNIPDYMLNVYENNAKVFEIPVAVGKEGTSTTMFTGDLNQIVFSPYWNIPKSIVKNELLQKIKANPNYLKSRNMEIVGKNDSLPTIRQLPGKDNALGKVKFLFPNRYDIYFHDTYAKGVFDKQVRAVSHGCIRLADAEKLANYLLRNNNAWTPEKINTAMNSDKEQYVKLSPSMPVIITYYTAWVDETGGLNFRNDLYDNDSKLAQMMFEPGAATSIPAKPQVKDSTKRKM